MNGIKSYTYLNLERDVQKLNLASKSAARQCVAAVIADEVTEAPSKHWNIVF